MAIEVVLPRLNSYIERLIDSKSEDNAVEESSSYLHDEAMRRINLLRRILPDRNAYACQGYGHKIWSDQIPFDDTQKIGIPISRLPPNSVLR